MTTAADQFRLPAESRFDKIRLKLRNILTPSQPVTEPAAFAGRIPVLTHLISAIEDQRLHIVLYGSRGMGKTSLLHVLTTRAREARYQVVYGSCGAGTSFSELLRSLCAGIPLRFHPDARLAGREAEQDGGLASLLPAGELSVRRVSDVLGAVIGTRVLLIIDEFDRSADGDFREKVADLIKILSDRASRVQLVIAGVGTNLTELIEHIPSIQRNILGVRIPLMTEDEVRQLLRIAHRHTGLVFSNEAADLVVKVSRGWPYLATLIAHHAALGAIRKGSLEAGLDDARDGVRWAAQEVASRLARDTLREVATAAQRVGRDCLTAAAQTHISAGGEFEAADLQAPGCEDVLDRLTSEQLLLRAKDDRFGRTYEFTDVTVPLHLWLSALVEELDQPGRL